MIHRAFLGLGGNVGDRLRYLRRARAALESSPAILLSRASRVYETSPVGPAQRNYLNAALEIRTRLSPEDLLSLCRSVERRLGRKRGRRWGPRTIDVDLLLVGRLSRRSRRLTLPHPRWTKRAFVLRPLADLAPRLRDPESGRTVSSLLRKLTDPDQWIKLYPASLE